MAAVKTQSSGARRARGDAVERQIIEAADRLFRTQGYVGTTIDALADAAGVAIQTIYNVVGPKSAVLSKVLDAAAAGPEAPRPVVEFMQERTADASDASAMVELLGDWFVEVHRRTNEVFEVIRNAAAVDPDIAALDTARARRRMEHYRLAATELARRSGANPDLSLDEAAAMIWSIGHPETYRFLVIELGWTPEGYRRWVTGCLRATLLAHG